MAKFEDFLSKETAGLPNWSWALIIVAGIGATYILPKFFGKSGNTAQTSSDTGTSASGIGLAVDPTTGLPYAVEGLVPSGGTVSTGSTADQNTLQKEIGLIRVRGGNPLTQSVDKKNPQGVAIRPTPSGKQAPIGFEPYGSQVVVTGPPVQGDSNLGTSLWFPVTTTTGKAGFVSAFDFSGQPVTRPITWPYA